MRVFLIHGWEGRPDNHWFPWLTLELKARGFEVFAPAMPNAANPKVKEWLEMLSDWVGKPDEETYFVGHSLGCITILRYLETVNTPVGGAIFVAGWFNLTDETWDEIYTREIAGEWINTPVNFKSIKEHTGKFVLVNSDNDPYVPLSDADLFKNNLGADIITLKSRGHIPGENGVTELPIVLEELLKMAK